MLAHPSVTYHGLGGGFKGGGLSPSLANNLHDRLRIKWNEFSGSINPGYHHPVPIIAFPLYHP